MVLESLINPMQAEKKFRVMFFYGLLYTTIGLLLALWVFQEESSLVMVFLTVIAAVPLMYLTIKYEEEKDMEIVPERLLIKEHGKALKFFMYFFFGMIVAYALWFTFLPETVSNHLFNTQITTIQNINSNVVTGDVVVTDILAKIFFNNVKVLLFCVFFAFFYGAGAIFILTWNASVIGAAIGNFIKAHVFTFSDYFYAIPLGIMRYMTHGVFEILAYFMAGLAGGIISIAVIRHDVYSDKFNRVVKDSLDMLGIALLLLVVGALVEVFVTPAFF